MDSSPRVDYPIAPPIEVISIYPQLELGRSGPSRTLEELNLILSRCPQNLEARLDRARIFEDLTLIEFAIGDYRYILSLYPDNQIARRSLELLVGKL
jgi:hypothetical protein